MIACSRSPARRSTWWRWWTGPVGVAALNAGFGCGGLRAGALTALPILTLPVGVTLLIFFPPRTMCCCSLAGSMAGAPIALVKHTLSFLVENVTGSDRVGVVSFSSDVQVNQALAHPNTPQAQAAMEENIAAIKVEEAFWSVCLRRNGCLTTHTHTQGSAWILPPPLFSLRVCCLPTVADHVTGIFTNSLWLPGGRGDKHFRRPVFGPGDARGGTAE